MERPYQVHAVHHIIRLYCRLYVTTRHFGDSLEVLEVQYLHVPNSSGLIFFQSQCMIVSLER